MLLIKSRPTYANTDSAVRLNKIAFFILTIPHSLTLTRIEILLIVFLGNFKTELSGFS